VDDKCDILILGASGMLGSAVRNVLGTCDGTQSENPHAPDYLDILETPPDQWLSRGLSRRYDYIINCIGVLKPAVKEHDSSSLTRAIRINSLFPHALAEVAHDAHIIHISTDGVFSGTHNRPYLESDSPDCSDAYGRTKALGECPAPNVLNIRCSIIGRDPQFGKGLMEWVLRAREGDVLNGYEDHLWNGVTTRQFGLLCRSIIESGEFDRIRRESGVHHFCPNPAITKYDLLCAIQEAAGREDIAIRRSHSGAPNTRILATLYSQLRAHYPDARSWNSVIKEALAD